jgi:hypothetical protein
MAYESVKIRDIVDRSVNHSWSIPEFQRGFVWKSTQVRDLVESLWLDYPIGSLLVWNSQQQTEERIVRDAQRPTLWVVDGQQRATALCILFGRKPYWWSEDWDKMLKKYDIRFDIDAAQPPYFWVTNAVIRKAKPHRYIPVSQLLVLDLARDQDQQSLMELARQVKLQGFCDGKDVMEVYARLDRVRKIREQDIVTITISQELEDVVEIFSRLNSKGTRVTEADIYLGVVAARSPGWVRDTFLPYLKRLSEAGFNINPNLLFRTLTGIGAKKVRFKEIPDEFWDATQILPYWSRTQDAWKNLISRFREYGILSNDPMPTEAALVTIIALVEKFPTARFEPFLYWFLQASRFRRYSGSGTTSLDEDLRDVSEATDHEDAVDRLLKRFPHENPLEPEDFLRDYTDSRFGRFLLYLLVYRNHAVDWDDRGHRLGFQGLDLLSNFRPQWHHIFPQKFLENKVPEEKINALANIAVIGPEINIRIRAQNPMDYIDRYKINSDKLSQQLIDEDLHKIEVSGYPEWLQRRAVTLAKAGNQFIDSLRSQTGG